jgi:hypothetical protein
VTGKHGRTELDDGLPQWRDRGGYAGREYCAGEGERGPEHDLMQVQVLPPVRTRRPVTSAGTGLASRNPDAVGSEGWAAGPHGCPDTIQAVWARLYLLRGSMQRRAHKLREVMWLTGWWTASHDYSCSSAARSAAMPRAVWLLTAPRLIRIVAAISASDRSA